MAWRKRTKRLWILAIAIGSILILLAAAATFPPAWYHEDAAFAPEAADRAEDKLIVLHNRLARIPGLESARLTGHPPASDPFEPVVLEFSAEEFNAILWKWAEIAGVEWNGVGRPQVAIDGDKILFATHIVGWPIVATVACRPWVDGEGRLHLEVAGIRAGHLPIPGFLLGTSRRNLASEMSSRLSQWQPKAEIKPNGRCNWSAARVASGKILLDALKDRPGDGCVIVPLDHDMGVAARVKELRVAAGRVYITLVPLNARQRDELAARLRR